MGYSPWGRKESDTTRHTQHSMQGAYKQHKNISCSAGSWGIQHQGVSLVSEEYFASYFLVSTFSVRNIVLKADENSC